MSVTHDQLVKALAKPGDRILADMTPEAAHLIHMAIGVAGEAFELFSAVMNNSTREHIVEELGDVEFYIEGVRNWGGFVLHHSTTPQQEGEHLFDMLDKAGELLDLAKKVAFYKDESKYAKVGLTLQHLRTNMGQVYHLLDVTYEEAVEGNINKLSERYAGLQYSNEAAINRKDKSDE